jgi:hypothetical protein
MQKPNNVFSNKESRRNNQIYFFCRKQSVRERNLFLLFKNAQSRPNMWKWMLGGKIVAYRCFGIQPPFYLMVFSPLNGPSQPHFTLLAQTNKATSQISMDPLDQETRKHSFITWTGSQRWILRGDFNMIIGLCWARDMINL